MKRSAMIDMMASNLYIWNGSHMDSPSWEKLDQESKSQWIEQAEMLLALQEGGGMLPPRNPDLTMSMVLNRADLNKWESET